MKNDMMNKKLSVLLMIALVSMGVLIPSASATTCTDAGDFSGVCTVLVSIFNGTMAVISVITTGTNASIIIEAVIIIAIVTFIVDLARGKNSYIRRKFGEV